MEMDNSSSINVKVLRTQLDRLSSVKDIPISQLNDFLLEDFTAITSNISSLIGTDGYNLLFKEIQARFPPNVSSVKPGTVAGYFMGCFVPSNFKYGKNCSLACITGAPQFYDSIEQDSCKKNVYLAPFDGEYQLTKLVSGVEDNNTAIIYIQPPFQGFSKEEVQKLKSEGIENIIFSYYDKNDYYTSDPLSFENLNVRTSSSGPRRSVNRIKYGNGYSTPKVIHTVVFIILLIIAGLTLWYN